MSLGKLGNVQQLVKEVYQVTIVEDILADLILTNPGISSIAPF